MVWNCVLVSSLALAGILYDESGFLFFGAVGNYWHNMPHLAHNNNCVIERDVISRQIILPVFDCLINLGVVIYLYWAKARGYIIQFDLLQNLSELFCYPYLILEFISCINTVLSIRIQYSENVLCFIGNGVNIIFNAYSINATIIDALNPLLIFGYAPEEFEYVNF